MKNITAALLAGLVPLLAISISAAEAPTSAEALKKEATSIVSGTVVEVTATKEKAKVDKGFFNRDRIFKIRLKVAKVSKGDAVKTGETIIISAWQAHRRLPWHAGPQGHSNIPKKDAKITVYLKGKEGEAYRPIRPNGIVIEKETD